MTKRKTTKKKTDVKDQTVDVQPDGQQQASAEGGSAKKQICLRQFLVSGEDRSCDPPKRKAAFIVATCAKTANDEFDARFPKYVRTNTMQTAFSELTKEWLAEHDPWKEHRNWEIEITGTKLTPAGERYFALKKAADDNAEYRKAHPDLYD